MDKRYFFGLVLPRSHQFILYIPVNGKNVIVGSISVTENHLGGTRILFVNFKYFFYAFIDLAAFVVLGFGIEYATVERYLCHIGADSQHVIFFGLDHFFFNKSCAFKTDLRLFLLRGGFVADDHLRLAARDLRQIKVKIGGFNYIGDLSEKIAQLGKIAELRKPCSHSEARTAGLYLKGLRYLSENARPVVKIFNPHFFQTGILQQILPHEHFRYGIGYRSTRHKDNSAAVVYLLQIPGFAFKIEGSL